MFRGLGALTKRELLVWVRSPLAIFSSLLFPVLYLILFGQAFNLNRLIPSGLIGRAFLGAPDYFSYFSLGMVGFVALTATLFVGATVIFDKRLGVVKKAIAAPIPRSSIFASRLFAGALRPLLLAFLVLGLAILFAHVNGLVGLTVTGSVTPLGIAEILAAIVLLSMMFTSLFLAVGFALDNPQSYFGAVNLLNLPVLFTSDALYPRTTMPGWLQSVSAYNPVSLGVNVLRENLFTGSAYPSSPETYLLGLVGWALLLGAVAFFVARKALAAR
jgi:ABC-2 type transport system permease protein